MLFVIVYCTGCNFIEHAYRPTEVRVKKCKLKNLAPLVGSFGPTITDVYLMLKVKKYFTSLVLVSITMIQKSLYFLLVGSIVDLTFRILTCRFLLAVVSRTWDLVCINLSFASRDFVCARSTATSNNLDYALHFRFCPSAWTPRFQKVELCIASAWTTLAVSAVAPSWSYFCCC